MKKVMIILFVNSLLFISCAKEKNLIKNIAGNWTVDKVDGLPINPCTEAGITFSRDDKFLEISSGTFSRYYDFDLFEEYASGTYKITSNDQITLTYPDKSHDILTVNSITDSTMVLTDPKSDHIYSLYKN